VGYYAEQVKAAIEATTIISSWELSWKGKTVHKFTARARKDLNAELNADRAERYLTFALQSQLYRSFYCPGVVIVADETALTHSPFGQMDFVEDLSEANNGTGSWEPGWTCRRSDNSDFIVARDGLHLKVESKHVRQAHGLAISEHATVDIRFPKEMRGVSPGFYMALSDRPFADEIDVLRLYFNLTPGRAVTFMGELTRLLNAARFPFRFKLINNMSCFDRCDSGVLYIKRNDLKSISLALSELYAGFASAFGERVPALTKVLAPGLGLAENPVAKDSDKIESFGMSRCRLLAEGMIEAFRAGIHDTPRRMRIVNERFCREGISLEAPYLNPGSSDEYERLFHAVELPESLAREGSGQLGTRLTQNQVLEAALKIGQQIADSALWYRDRCTWISIQPALSTGPGKASAAATLTADVYSGLAGIALFLAELSRATGDREIVRTALGALRQAALSAERVPSSHRIGLYTGWIGIAIALVRVGCLLNNAEIQDSGNDLVNRVVDSPRNDSGSDFLSGRAGSIVGLLVLDRMLGDRRLTGYAELLAGELVTAAHRKDNQFSWVSKENPKRRHLAGFSHGAGGIGHAFQELFEVTHDVQWLECANKAFAYEADVFDSSVGNWPDFRNELNLIKMRGRNTFVSYWCHGAPGIALSRMRSSHHPSGACHQEELSIALNTTRLDVESQLRDGPGNFCLCHGLAGNADVLLAASMNGIGEFEKNLPQEVGQFGIKQYSANNSWPIGVGNGLNQSLMLGMAGIGYYYLRLYDSSTPSLLTFKDYPCRAKCEMDLAGF